MKLNEFHQMCPECGGPAFSSMILAEKKDACYYKVKAGAKVWPSAYASGRLVQCRKKGAANYGNKSESVAEGSIEKTATGLKHHGDFPDYPGSKGQQFQTDYDRLNKGQTGRLDKALGVRWDPINKRKEISADPAGVAEEWSQKYKSSINCSHPKGFSQKAHCAGKKKQNESVEMEMVCEMCGMCETHQGHEHLDEACWKGYHKEGNKKMFGKTYPNCVKNAKEDIDEASRIARKAGQPAKSKKHSDLYTDENPRGTITGLKFATTEDARASVSKIKSSGRSHAHKIQAAVAMEQRAKAAGKASAAAVYRAYINANKKTNEQQLDEKCWDGYSQQGMKEKGSRMVPNCVKNEDKENNMDELSRILELGTGISSADRAELNEEFDLIENIIEDLAELNGVDADMIWEDLDSLSDDELYVFAVTTPVMEDWQKANKRDRTAGMSQKAVNAYRRENPGSKLKTAVTTKPSKLKKGSKASKRRKSYCSRSRGQMKMHNISCAKTPDKAICKARRRWNC